MFKIKKLFVLLLLTRDLLFTNALLERNASNRSALFVKVPDSIIGIPNLAQKGDVYTALECLKLCLQISNCKSVDYNKVNYVCFPKGYDRLDYPLHGNSNFDYYDTIVAVSIAEGKPSIQSSNYYQGSLLADQANDGHLSQTSDACAHTQSEANAWWKVDLQKKYVIVFVQIWNRGDCCPERLQDVNAEVADSEDFTENQQLCIHFLK